MESANLNFEKIWLLFQETSKQIQESDKKFQRQLEESDKKLQKHLKETDKKIRSLEKLFTGQWGKLMESLVEGDLIPLLNARGIFVNQTSQRLKKIFNNQDFEIDIVAKNGKEVVFVEVKTTLTPDDVKDFLNKLQIIKTVFPEYADNIVYGAIAYLRSESDAHLRAIRKGLFVIRATGKSASIINSEDFRPTHF
ncbi:MAG: YraN family protein [Leptospiraceae bacterium]|nr:YraN family protein [Leptospiraceae bacterium]MCP5494418.1 YraN family protein [Leptospiraceae bacterium]